MKLRWQRRLSIAVALLALLAGNAFASGAAMFVCRGDMVARTTCCCAQGQHALARFEGARSSVSAGCCCDISQAKSTPAPAIAESRSAGQIAPLTALLPLATSELVSWPVTARAWPSGRLAHPPPLAVPILLVKQSFLI
jgi:hypothetical protein